MKQKGAYLSVLTVHIENTRFSYDFLMKITSELNEEEKKDFLKIFSQDQDGYFIEWVVDAIAKRKNYLDSRSSNKAGKTKNHMISVSESYGNSNRKRNSNKKEIKTEGENGKILSKKVIEKFNEITGSRYKSVTENFVKAVTHWSETYSEDEILKSIKNIPSNEYWSDKMTPIILFRKSDQQGNPVDYIGMLLNQKPTASKARTLSRTAEFIYE
jgi:uncharacterized protein (DUF342 family)